MTISTTPSAPACPPLFPDRPRPLLSSNAQPSVNVQDIGLGYLFAVFIPDRAAPSDTAAGTDAGPIDFRAKHAVRHYQGDTDMGTPRGPLYAVEEQALAQLRVGEGKYATLPIIRDILQRWHTDGPSRQVRVAYANWRNSGSLELLLDALVAEMQQDGTWSRLARKDAVTGNIHDWVSAALTGNPYGGDGQADRQAGDAGSDWSALDAVENRAVEKQLRFIKVMEAAFQEPDMERHAGVPGGTSPGTVRNWPVRA